MVSSETFRPRTGPRSGAGGRNRRKRKELGHGIREQELGIRKRYWRAGIRNEPTFERGLLTGHREALPFVVLRHHVDLIAGLGGEVGEDAGEGVPREG